MVNTIQLVLPQKPEKQNAINRMAGDGGHKALIAKSILMRYRTAIFVVLK